MLELKMMEDRGGSLPRGCGMGLAAAAVAVVVIIRDVEALARASVAVVSRESILFTCLCIVRGCEERWTTRMMVGIV